MRTAFDGPQLVYVVNSSDTASTTESPTTDPQGLATGDINGDSRPDLVFVDATENKFYAQINWGLGFGAATTFDVGEGPLAVALGDMNGDGDLDAAVANITANSVSILVNNGSAFFSKEPQDLLVEPGPGVPAATPRDVQLADIDADGDLDVITANSDDANQKSSVSAFLNDGTGRFLAATAENFPMLEQVFPVEVGRGPYAVRVADVNGDGAVDIITSSGYDDGVTSKISVLLAVP